MDTVRNLYSSSTKLNGTHVIAVVTCVLVGCVYLSWTTSYQWNAHTVMNDNRRRTNEVKTILFWTPFFGTYNLVHEWNRVFTMRGLHCTVTSNRTTLGTADAVVFHLRDLNQDLPTHRYSDQVWVILNKESLAHIDVAIIQRMQLNRAFNWTMSYRRDSTVVANYGEFVPLSREERLQYRPRNYAHNRTKMAASIISNCQDKAKRRILINVLAKYINIDQYGKCGKLSCPQTNGTICRSSEYRFRIAFENSNCRDYVTEKFWNALADGVIPIVNWRANQRPYGFMPPKTFINVYDFKYLADLGKYLNRVAKDEEEYTSYFEWRKHFRIDFSTNAMRLCNKLQDPSPNQDIPDLTAWIKNGTCNTMLYIGN